jgi:hypothetical protein
MQKEKLMAVDFLISSATLGLLVNKQYYVKVKIN